jgi:hypothetical protein
MAVDEEGHVLTTSSGFEVSHRIAMPDVEKARLSPDGIGEFRGKIGGENVLAISMLSPVVDDSIMAARLVVSLSEIDQSITTLVLIAVAFGILIIFFMVLSGSYFYQLHCAAGGRNRLNRPQNRRGDFATGLTKKMTMKSGPCAKPSTTWPRNLRLPKK